MNTKSIACLNNVTLKLIAITTMLIDHIGAILFPEIQLFRIIGRISFPIFCFLLVEGFHHTRSQLNYLVRLLIFALLSEIPFDLALRDVIFDWQHQNIFFTLALGLVAIFCLEELHFRKIYTIPFGLILLASHFSKCDYGLAGVLLICIFYYAKEQPWVRIFLCGLVLYMFFGTFELYALIAFIPITLYNGKLGSNAKFVFYWFYPIHLLVLFGLSMLF